MGSLKKRILTAGVGLPVVGWFLQTEGGVLVLLCICGILACAECQALKAGIVAKLGSTKPGSAPISTRLLFDVVTVGLLLWTFMYSTLYEIGDPVLRVARAFITLVHICSAVNHHARSSSPPRPPEVAQLVGLLLDLAIIQIVSQGLCYLLMIRRLGLGITVAFVTVVWQTDNGALFFGSLCSPNDYIGQFFPSHLRGCLQVLSPNKSISGLVGGLLLGTATAALIGFLRPLYFDYTTLPAHECSTYALLGLALSVLAICGDLLESFVKRVAQLKDSGSLLPGHGGILDRLDSLLMAAPFFFTVVTMDRGSRG